MAAKFNGPYPDPLITGASLASSFTGSPSSMETFDNICYQLNWSGASPLGAINVQVSNDYNPRFPTLGTWTYVESVVGVPIVISPGGAAGTGIFDLNQLPGQWVRLSYTTAGGSVGTLNSVATMKAV
jgi:hypothetical protein